METLLGNGIIYECNEHTMKYTSQLILYLCVCESIMEAKIACVWLNLLHASICIYLNAPFIFFPSNPNKEIRQKTI
jgi:hypothetical protein